MTAANPNRGRPREREATRNVIIDAARRVAAREGIGAVSLSRVANEANFATGVVYGHFRSKNELLLSMVANDLSTMAHEMRETGWPDDEAGAQAALPLEEPVHEQIPNTIAEVAEEPAPQEDVEPFAGNAGLTAVARALQLPEEEITVAHEELAAPHEEIFSEVSYATEPLAEEVLESQPIIEEEILEHQPVEIAAETDVAFETPIQEISFEPSAPAVEEHAEETFAPTPQHEAVLPEEDLDPFGNGVVHKELAARKTVFPEDDMDPFGDAAQAGERHSFGKAKSVLPEEDLNPFVSAPAETFEAPAAKEPDAETQFEPVAEEPIEATFAESVEEAPALVDDGEQMPGASEIAVQNMPTVQKKRQERTQLNEIINRLVMPDAPASKGTSGAIARFDRRMGVFEKALADMEVRYNAIERDKADVVKVFSDDVKALTARVEAGEKRALEITSELRGGILDAKTRLAAVEAIMASTKMGTGPSLVSPVAPMEAEAPKVDFTPTPVSREIPVSQPKTNGDDFLSAARRSAAAAMPFEPVMEEEKNSGSNRMRYLLGGGSVLILMLAAGGYFVSASHTKHAPTMHAKHTAVRHVHVVAPKPVVAVAPIAQTPAVSTPATQAPAASSWPVAQPAAPVMAAPAIAPAPVVVASPKTSRKHKARMVAAQTAHTVEHAAPVHVAPEQAVAQPQSDAAPLDHLTSLARAGNAKAQMIVGLQYLESGGDKASKAAAAHWLHEAATKGESIAQYRLGTLYQRGLGVPADTIEAMHWYEAAAKQGNVKAMYNLGLAYVQNGSAPKDFAQAARWFTAAANLGFVDAQFNLAVLYERGAGVTQSLVDAYKWYAIAAAQGDSVSRERIQALGTQLNADDLMLAQKTAQAFRPSAPDHSANAAPQLSDLN